MKRLSKLSQECIRNKGLCCEDRLNVVLSEKEEKLLNSRGKMILNRCRHFKKPYCTIYNRRPVDCKAYPVTLDLRKGKVIFAIDMKCPAVKKGIIDDKFLEWAKKQWKTHWPSREWIVRNSEDNRTPGMYKWVTLGEYQRYRKNLRP